MRDPEEVIKIIRRSASPSLERIWFQIKTQVEKQTRRRLDRRIWLNFGKLIIDQASERIDIIVKEEIENKDVRKTK